MHRCDIRSFGTRGFLRAAKYDGAATTRKRNGPRLLKVPVSLREANQKGKSR